MSKKETALFTLLIVLSIGLAFTAGYLTRDVFSPAAAELPILAQASEILEAHAYSPLPADPALEYGMIRGMLQAYGDPFTSFNEPAQHELQTDSLEGSYGGIGVRLERDPDGNLALFPFAEGPAAAAGILAGDLLLEVDGLEITAELDSDTITSAIRGQEGTRVNVRILRPPTGEELGFEITRQEVPLPSVTWRTAFEDPRIGLVEVNLIADSTPQEIALAVAALQAEGASFFVLDLRNNGGGLLEAGVDCARLFLSEGVVIEQQYRGQEIVAYEVEEPGELADVPLVVWVNQGTASAAEICAGALQANGRAPLIGTHTFGKDAIQLVFELQDGSSIQVTAAKWWFPDLGFPNEGQGLLPDAPAASDEEYFTSSVAIFSP